jgi:enoyl-CoA hydratase/carnithine racemase
MDRDKTITTELRGHVFLIGVNRPEKLNGFNTEMLRGLSEAWLSYENDPEARCALVFAYGDNFTAGLDLADVGTALLEGESVRSEKGMDFMNLRRPRRTKPVVCCVQGWCLTIGVELLLASDIRIAAENTRFAQMEVQRGFMPFGGATIRLPQVAGWGNAMLHLLTGDEFDAREALRIGLIQEVVPDGQQFERGLQIAELVADQAPLAVQATLRSAWLALEEGPEAAMRAFPGESTKAMATEDVKEGMAYFLDRRKARFKGK